MDNKERNDALENMDEFNRKYNHYVSENDETQIVPVPQIKKKNKVKSRLRISAHTVMNP